MRLRPALCGLAAAVSAGLVLPAAAAPIPLTPPPQPAFSRTFDPTSPARVQARSAERDPDQMVTALVQLDAAPAGGTLDSSGPRRAAATARVARTQAAAVPRLEAAGARVHGRLSTVLNAVRVRTRVGDLDRLADVAGVRAVQVSRVVHLADTRSARATTTDQTWERLRLTGRGQVIGVIDTGVDYTHAGFGGPGTKAAFTGNDGTRIERGTFPTPKVVGGYDLVGDDYDPDADGSTALPRPDPDPLDCEGHGSHVAGIAAGVGVTTAGRPYRGPYTPAALKQGFAVAPGAAPQASLRVYRVFGCKGATGDDVILAAIDRAVRDGVDVLNLSLGSSWGSNNDLLTQAVKAATAAGVLVVAAAGNDGGRAYLAGSPATADSALAVAAVDTSRVLRGKAAPFSSGGPRRLDSAQKPDLAAPGVAVRSVRSGSGTRSAAFSGTSMATPQVAGIAALVRQAHPTWTPLQVKAALVSTASATAVTGYDSRRVGTGLVQARRAAAGRTHLSTPDGLDSLRFGMNQLSGAYREKRTFVVSNRSTSTVRYRLAPAFSSARRGASLTLSPVSVTLRSGKSTTVTATLALRASAVAALPGASVSDHGALSTLHGVVVATPTRATAAHPVLRMAFLSVPVPLSAVTASPSVPLPASGDPGPITLTNRGPHAATASVFQALLSDPAGDASSREAADVTALGVQVLPAPSGDRSDRLMVFAVGQAAGTSTQGTRSVELRFDVDADGIPDHVLYSGDTGYEDEGSPDGTLSSYAVDQDGYLVDRWTASAPANGSTVLLPVLASSLGISASGPKPRIQMSGYSNLDQGLDDVAATARYQPFRPALSSGATVRVPPGRTVRVPTRVDRSRLAGQTSEGWLVVTPDDAAGLESDRVRLRRPSSSSAARGN